MNKALTTAAVADRRQLTGKREKDSNLTKLMTTPSRKGEKLDLPDVADIVPNLPIIHLVNDHNLLDTEEAKVENKSSVRADD